MQFSSDDDIIAGTMCFEKADIKIVMTNKSDNTNSFGALT